MVGGQVRANMLVTSLFVCFEMPTVADKTLLFPLFVLVLHSPTTIDWSQWCRWKWSRRSRSHILLSAFRIRADFWLDGILFSGGLLAPLTGWRFLAATGGLRRNVSDVHRGCLETIYEVSQKYLVGECRQQQRNCATILNKVLFGFAKRGDFDRSLGPRLSAFTISSCNQ